MSKLYFKVSSDWEEVVKLRNEIVKLKQELKSMDSTQSPATFKTLNTQLAASTQQLDGLVAKAAQAGAVMEGDFKKKIFDASQSVNGFTEKIIAQKNAVGSLQTTIRKNKELYKNIVSRGGEDKALLNHIREQERALGKERDALFNLTQQQAEARLSVKKIRDEYALYKDDAKDVTEANNGVAVSWKKALAVIGGAGVLKALGSEMIRVRGEFQAADTAIQTLLGSKEKADALMAQVREYAKISPLEFSDVTSATQMMLGFNIEAERVPRYLQAIGDVSMGNTQKFNSLTLAFSQMSAAGKLMGQDLNQMINAGFNPFQIMSEKTGKSIATLKDEMSKGAISAEMVQQAFIDATSAGGRFYNMSENASKEINGQLSMMQDALDSVFNELGQKSEGVIMDGIQMTTSLIENYETVGKVLAGLVVTYGTYRTAVMLVTAAENGHSAATLIMRGRILLAQKAQALLNATMLKNPYVLLATVAIGAASAVWAFSKRTTEAQEVQERYNASKEDAIRKEESHRQEIQRLISVAGDEAEATANRNAAIESLKKAYPGIIEKYIDEEGHLTNLIQLQKDLNEEQSKRKKESNQEKLASINAKVRNQEEYVSGMSGSKEAINEANDVLKELQRQQKEAQAAVNTDYINARIEEAKKFSDDELKKAISQWKSSLSRVTEDMIGEFSRDEVSSFVKSLETLQSAREKQSKNKKYWETKKKEAETALNSIASSQKKLMDAGKFKGIDETVIKSYKDNVKKLKEAEKELKVYDSSSKQESAAEKLRKQTDKYNVLLEKQALEQKRNAEDLQMRVDEARIKAMDEGSAKTIAEMELNFEKEMQAIDRQKEDTLRKKIEDARATWETSPDKKKGETFNASGITLSISENDVFDNLYKSGIASFEKNLKEYQNKQDNAWNEYYIKYGEYQEKRKAIMDKYDKQIADAEEGSVEKSTFIAQRKEDLDSLDDELMKNSELWGRFFTDFSNRSSSSIRNIIEDIQELIDYMNGIEGTKIPDLFKDNEKTVKAINDAMANPSSLNKFTSSLSSQIAKFKKMLDKDNPFKMIQDGFKNNDYESTSKGFGSIASAVKELDGVLGDLGVKSESTAGKVTSVLSSTASYAATGASIGGPWGAVIGGAIGMASGLIGVLGADYSAYNKMKEEYGALIDVWDTLISKKQKYIDISYGDEARKAGQEVLDLLNKKAQSSVALGIERLNAGASAGSHSIGVRQRKGMSSQGWDELRKAAQSIGFNYNSVADGRMTGLFSLTAEQLERLQEEAPTFWAKLDDDVQGYLQNIIDCSDEIEDMKTKLQETMTGVSFDSFYDSFVSTLSDMGKSSKDMADDFGEYLKNAILENLVANKYRAKIEALYNDWAAKSDSDGDGVFDLTAKESAELKDAQKALAEQIIAERDAMADAFGWSSQESTSQSSTSRGFGTEMTHEDAGELSGRFTALQIAGEEIKTQNIAQTQSLNLLTVRADAILSMNTETRNIADDTRNLIAQSYLELVQISENTGNSAKYLKDIKADIAEVKKNTSKL
ncbi:tape measure protein [Bacteroides cellulosilyticus]|uniref:tape measure protein n=1 Tax=Bacteroides cellulosilyticus TaxID=246787 RepID=UPI001CCC7534|nr:tape measure protein [Bacteroides cellulosilyticus]UBD69073.1 tape measure protein [Bacteroides cellulosilyticus]